MLRSTTRSVNAIDDYNAAWAQVSDRMRALGGRAWIFRSTEQPAKHIEFLEWKQLDDTYDLLSDPELDRALNRMDNFGRGTIETWIEP